MQDLAEAHLAAARRLGSGGGPDASGESGGGAPGSDLTVNIGTGKGVSVREMADLGAEITGKAEPAARVAPRRAGDPAKVVASSELAAKELGWTARHSVRDMLTSAWEGWCLLHPEAR